MHNSGDSATVIPAATWRNVVTILCAMMGTPWLDVFCFRLAPAGSALLQVSPQKQPAPADAGQVSP